MTSSTVSFDPPARLRLLADWFDMYDAHAASGRVKVLLDPRSPGQHGISADLRSIAANLPWPASDPGPGARELQIIARWFEADPAVLGRQLDEKPGPGSQDVQRALRAIAARLESRGRTN
jgi:hypothetical protein